MTTMTMEAKTKRAAAKKVAQEAAGEPPADKTPMFDAGETGESSSHGVARDQLRSIVERIERLAEEKATIAEDIKEVYAEAKSNSFDTKALRKVIAIRKLDPDERMEQEAVLDTYLAALGMLPEGPDA